MFHLGKPVLPFRRYEKNRRLEGKALETRNRTSVLLGAATVSALRFSKLDVLANYRDHICVVS